MSCLLPYDPMEHTNMFAKAGLESLMMRSFFSANINCIYSITYYFLTHRE